MTGSLFKLCIDSFGIVEQIAVSFLGTVISCFVREDMILY